MPIYEYTDADDQLVTRCVAVDERDSQPGLKRVEVPRSVRVLCGEASPEQIHARSVMKGYHDLECKEGSRFRSSFTPQQIKKAWANN